MPQTALCNDAQQPARTVTLSRYRTAVLLVLVCHAVLLGGIDWQTSANRTEIAHMVAGLYTWQTFHFDVFHVNPPLVRVVATAPVAAYSPKQDWAKYSVRASDRCEWSLARAFMEVNDFEDTRWYFTLARWVCIPFSVLGGYMCCHLAATVYGRASGLCAMVLWCSSPTVLAWGATICPAVGAAALGVAAIWAFRHWLLRASWCGSLVAGFLLGLLPLTKLTWGVAFGLWPLLWLAWLAGRRKQTTCKKGFCQLVILLALAVYVMNVGYLFEGTFKRMGGYRFISKAFSCVDNSERNRPPVAANRFEGTWLGKLRTPLPASMVQGIDTQRYDFERGLPSYLRGQWAAHGWWYYYLYALAVKVPLGTWCLVALAVGFTLVDVWNKTRNVDSSRSSPLAVLPKGQGRSSSAPWRDEMLVLAPGLAILIVVSSQTGFSVHSRYVIPALPFIFVWASKVGQVFEIRPLSRARRALAGGVVVALTSSVGSSLWTYPHNLSYFNELVGGPKHGGEHLLGSNVDWGQDLLYLKRWLDEHPDVRLDGLAYYASCPLTLAGIPETPHPPAGPESEYERANRPPDSVGPKPGWYAVSVNYLYDRSRQYRYFLQFEPVDSVAYSIYIYHITLDEANRVRRELWLPDLVEDCQRERKPELAAGTRINRIRGAIPRHQAPIFAG